MNSPIATTQPLTLGEHLSQGRRRNGELAQGLAAVLRQIGYAGKALAREIGRVAFSGELGYAGGENSTGDSQKKLDVVANDIVVEALARTGLVAAIVSEELADPLVLATDASARYVVCMDPLDGSSNTDINGAIGSIFGIYLRRGANGVDLGRDLLRRGSEQLAAGYVMYGTSTVLVLACGEGVHGFTLDREVGEFVVSHPNIRCPSRGHYFSANLGNAHEWPAPVRAFVAHVTERDPATRRPYSLRYAGALVADVHRSLIEGGLYFYPPDVRHRTGKLRFLYECAPLAFLVEQAGGRASTGAERILDLRAEHIHQRVPLVIGSREDVLLFEQFHAGAAATLERP